MRVATTTTTIRTSVELRRRLDRTAKRLKTNRNQLINELLEESLQRRDKEARYAELKRQAQLVAEHDRNSKDSQEVEQMIDEAVREWWDEVK